MSEKKRKVIEMVGNPDSNNEEGYVEMIPTPSPNPPARDMSSSPEPTADHVLQNRGTPAQCLLRSESKKKYQFQEDEDEAHFPMDFNVRAES